MASKTFYTAFICNTSELQSVLPAQAEDGLDVRGGIFGGTAANQGIFENPSKIPNSGYISPRTRSKYKLPKQGPSEKKLEQLDAAMPDSEHTFKVSQEELNAKVKSTAPASMPPSGDNAAMLQNANRIMGQARSMLMRSESSVQKSTSGFREPGAIQAPALKTVSSPPKSREPAKAEKLSQPYRAEYSKDPAALTLVVEGTDAKQLADAVEQLNKIQKFSKLAGAQIVMLNYEAVLKSTPEPVLNFRSKAEAKKFLAEKNNRNNPITPAEYEKKAEQMQLLENANFHPSSIVTVDKLKNQFSLETSPTWIVSADGKNHIFAGNQNSLINLFNLKGQFKAPEITGRSVVGTDTQLAKLNQRDNNTIHYPKRSGSPLKLEPSTTSAPATAVIYSLSKKRAQIDPEDYQAPDSGPKPKLTVPKLPHCDKDNVRRTKIGAPSSQLSKHDILFYDSSNRSQSEQSKHWAGKKIGYPNGVPQEEISTSNMQWTLAQTLAVQCLPTRYRVIETDGATFFEHREGRKAWFQDAK
ncbi:MAG: hypothetical protein KDD66_04025 [Bdellovibrionales bacterium]|nr:hypothetical protein [Bdellovibrionales bacterium]